MSSPGAPGTPLDRATHEELSSFLARLQPDARVAFLALRALLVSLGRDVGEKAAGNELAYARRERTFLVVRSGRSHVLVVFPRSVPLEDSLGRLLKKGEERHAALSNADDLDGHIQEFVRRAYAASR